MNTERGNIVALVVQLVLLALASLALMCLWRVLHNTRPPQAELETTSALAGGLMFAIAFIRVVWCDVPGVEQ